MVVGCGIGCDHGQMWWNTVQCCVKCGVMHVADLKYGIAKRNGVLREVLVWYGEE